MTIRELYEWAKEKDVLDLDIEIPRRDALGGCDDAEPEIDNRSNPWNTKLVVTL